MSVRRLAPDDLQPPSFEFTKENLAWAKTIIAKFPEGRQASAVIPLLWRAQEQHDYWLPRAAIEKVGQMLGMSAIRVLEIATFYTMFNLAPVGRHFVQVCGTTPCRLRGAEKIIAVCKREIGPERQVSADGAMSWLEVECLGACCNAPMVQINNDVYEDLNEENFTTLLADLRAGRKVKVGSQIGRRASEPVTGQRTLLDGALYDGSVVGAWQADFAERLERAAAAKKAAAEAAAAVLPPAPPKPAVAPAKAAAAEDDGGPEAPPATRKAARDGKPDDLQQIKGVGPKLEAMLHSMGFFHFDQIASWTEDNLRWVDRRLDGFKGRARRDDWIGQARALAAEGRKGG